MLEALISKDSAGVEQKVSARPLGDIALVLGTRPEIVKLAPVIRALGDRGRVVHTGQHWDAAMAGQFYSELGLGDPHVRLDAMRGVPRGLQISRGMEELIAHFEADRPRVVIVQGDTNSVSAGAQAANYLNIPLVHVEAGLRSYDRAMPEEINRLVVGALADLHCAPTEHAARNLRAEGVSRERIVVTGNTVVETTQEALAKPTRVTVVADAIVATIHRPENTDDPHALQRVLRALQGAPSAVVFCMHPRTESAIERHGLGHLLAGLDVRVGVGHADFLALANAARLLVSDSGGVQEEVTVMKKPLLVVRRSTERPEAVESGFANLITPDRDLPMAIVAALEDDALMRRLESTPSPYGDGHAGERIAAASRALADVPN